MTDGLLHFMDYDPQLLRLPAPVNVAMRQWFLARYPTNTAKAMARDIGCDVRTAENILQGHLSSLNFTKMLRAYGWDFLAGVGAAVIGETYEAAIERELQEIADARAQLDDAERRARGSWARVRARGSVDRGGLRLVAESDGDAGGEVGRERRDVGAQPPR